MLITCPHCVTSYDLPATALGDNGRTVRCVRCKQTWFEAPALATSAQPVAAQTAEPAFAQTFDDAPAEARINDSSSAPLGDGGELPPEQPENAEPEGLLPIEGKPADFITPNISSDDMSAEVVDAPPLVPAEPLPAEQDGSIPSGAPAIEAAPEPDFEQFVVRRAKRQAVRRKRTRPGVSAAIILLGALAATLLIWRSDVVRFAPQTASLYARIGLPVNLRGLVFEDVKSIRETKDGVTVLVVEGTIASIAKRPVEVPRVRFGLRNIAGNEIYSWTALPSRAVLEPGEKIAFQSRLASPPADGNDVSVRFFAARDAFSGTP